MKLFLTDDDGTVVWLEPHVEQYDLSKPMARAALLDEIREAIERATEARTVETA